MYLPFVDTLYHVVMRWQMLKLNSILTVDYTLSDQITEGNWKNVNPVEQYAESPRSLTSAVIIPAQQKNQQNPGNDKCVTTPKSKPQDWNVK